MSLAIQEKIENYIYYLDDRDYIDAVLGFADMEILFSSITQMLQSGSKDRIIATNLFIGDAVRRYASILDKAGNPSSSEISTLFRENLPGSSVVDALSKNVFSNSFVVRNNTTHILGRTNLKACVPVLKRSFRESLDRDPLLLPQLVGALEWLGRTHIWKLIERMIRNPHAMTRWAALGSGFIDYFDTPETKRGFQFIQRQLHCLDMLKNDKHPLVREEAEYKWQLCQLAIKGEEPVKQPARPLFFELVQIQFWNYMSDMEQDDYSVSDLEAFVLQI